MSGEKDPFYLKVKDAAEAVGHSRAQLESAGTNYREKHTAFFEKLALLNGSALASSATVLGYFAPNHGAAHAQRVLEAAWIALLLAMITSFSRNYFSPLTTWHESFEIYTRKKSEYQRADADAMKNLDGAVLDRHSGQPLDRAEEMRLAGQNATQWEEAADKAARKAKLNKRLMDASEYTTLASTLAGMILLVIFTISNMAR